MMILPILLIGLICLLIGLAIGAVILRAACHLAKEDVPGFGRSMGIVAVTAVIQMAIGTVINLAFGLPITEEPRPDQVVETIAASLLGFAINVPVAMLLIYVMAPTSSFGKAALVWLIELLIIIAIAMIFTILIIALSMALGGF